MSGWLVTVVTGGAYGFGPAVLVDAETAEAAVEVGMQRLLDEDECSSRWGVACRECEAVAVDRVAVYPAGAAVVFEQTAAWRREQ